MDIDGKHQNQINNLGYDFVIRCMGFKFDFDLFQKFVYFNTEREFESQGILKIQVKCMGPEDL